MAEVYAAVRRDLAKLPDEVATSTDAFLALNLAKQLDDFAAGASATKELRVIMAGLRASVPEKKVDSVDDSRGSIAAKLRSVG